MTMTACSVLDVVNLLSSGAGSTQYDGIRYGTEQRHRLDLFIPENPAENAAWIVFFYGGGWTSGERGDYAFVGRRLAARGHYVVIPDYRLYPEVIFPDFIEDAARAVRWLQQNARTYAPEHRPLVLMGHSAGAQIAALLAMDTKWLSPSARTPTPVAGWIGLAGPYNFLPLQSDTLKQIFPPDVRENSQAINFVSAQAPPSLIIHGETDRRVLPANSWSLHRALAEAGAASQLILYPDTGHAAIMLPFAGLFSPVTSLIEDIDLFLRSSAPPA